MDREYSARTVAAGAMAAMALAAFMLGPDAAFGAPKLNRQVTVDNAAVRLGDLFTETGAKSDTAVVKAPAPGRHLALEARMLARIADTHGVAWRPLNRTDAAIVERASLVIEAKDIAAALSRALARRFDGDAVEVELRRRQRKIHLPTDMENSLKVTKLQLDRETGRFAATVIAAAGDPRAVRLAVAGRVHRLVEIPVLAHNLDRREVIEKADIEWVGFRADRIGANIVTATDGLVGMAARRRLKQGQPLRANDLEAPIVIGRGNLVTVLLRTASMTLTAQGRALDAGAKNETIRVMNTHSKNVIEARVTSPNLVTVTAPESLK